MQKKGKHSLITDPHDKRLYAPNAEVNPLSESTAELANKVFQAHLKAGGVGLAAPQIGINKQIIVVRHSLGNLTQDYIWLNPKIADIPEKGNDLYWQAEGCLSHPGISIEIARPKVVIVEVALVGTKKKQIIELGGMTARIFLHELDHIRGVLITDKGNYGRNITLNTAGQQVLMDSLKENLEHGYHKPEV